MRKKPRVRTLIDSQHDKGTETLIEIGQHYFSQIFFNSVKESQLQKFIFRSF